MRAGPTPGYVPCPWLSGGAGSDRQCCILCAEPEEHAHRPNSHAAEDKPAPDVCAVGNGCAATCERPEDVDASAFDLGFSRDGHSDPSKDVVLRIEAETEVETKVLSGSRNPPCCLGAGGFAFVTMTALLAP